MKQPEKKFYTKVEKPEVEKVSKHPRLKLLLIFIVLIIVMTIFVTILYYINIFFDLYRFEFKQPIIFQTPISIQKRTPKIVVITPTPVKKAVENTTLSPVPFYKSYSQNYE